MAISITSPNVDNYVRAGGRLYFQRDGAGDYIDLGNAPTFQLAQGIEFLDHNSSRQGKRVRDKRVIDSQSATLTIVLEEWTPRNMGLFLMGDPEFGVGDSVNIDIGALSEIKGALRWIGDNEGPSWQLDFPNVTFAPDGEMDMVSEEWAQIPLSCEVLYDEANQRFGTATSIFGVGAVPLNTLAPTIGGTAQDEEELSVTHPGLWSGSPSSYQYQWQKDNAGDLNFADIGGATAATYLLVTGDVGDRVRCRVKATNEAGQSIAWADSLPTVAVIAA